MHTNPFTNYRESYYLKDVVKNPNIIVGEYSYYAGYYHKEHFEDRVWYLDEKDKDCDKLIIGKFCSIATGATFMMAGNQGHRHDWLSSYPLEIFDEKFDPNGSLPPPAYLPKGDTVIENDVWIGAEALIMPGVKIGNGAVIAARTVVTKSVEPYAIVGGNPAKLIRKRFTEEEIKILLEIAWWNWEEEKIRKHLKVLQSGDVRELAKCF